MTETGASPRVRLRDVTLADADRFDQMRTAERSDGGFNDFGEEAKPVDREVLANGPLRNERNGVLLVERIEDATVIGTVGWHSVGYGPNRESQAWNVGIHLIPEARGKGYGVEAQRLLAEWLFEHTDANRVEASTDIENVAEQRSLERAAFRREGIARGSQFRAGAYHDLVTYARIRGDP